MMEDDYAAVTFGEYRPEWAVTTYDNAVAMGADPATLTPGLPVLFVRGEEPRSITEDERP